MENDAPNRRAFSSPAIWPVIFQVLYFPVFYVFLVCHIQVLQIHRSRELDQWIVTFVIPLLTTVLYTMELGPLWS